MSDRKRGFFYTFAVAATAAAAGTTALVDAKEVSAACSCMKAAIVRNIGSEVIKYLGAPSVGYEATLVTDELYGFVAASDIGVPAQVWFDWVSNSAASNNIVMQVCRQSYTGANISCGTVAQKTTTSTAHQEVEVPVVGLTSPNVSPWDLFKLRAFSSSNVAFTAKSIPTKMPKGL